MYGTYTVSQPTSWSMLEALGLEDIAEGAIAILLISLIGALALSIYFFSRTRYENSVWHPVKNWFFRLFNFDLYIFSSVVKFLYIFLTIFVICMSFVMMFQDDGFVGGLIMLIVGPIVIRLLYELFYIIFGIRDQLASVNRTLTDIKQGKSADGFGGARPVTPVAPAPAAAPVRPVAPAAAPRPAAPMGAAPMGAAPAAAPRPAAPMGAAPQAPRPAAAPGARRFCPKCGAEMKNGAPFCTNCGTKMN